MFDIIVIGAGVVGAAICRALSRYELSILWLEKEGDVSCGASKANSGIIHGGFDAKPGTLKAKLNVLGNQMFEQLDAELHFGVNMCGSYVLAFEEGEMETLKALLSRGAQNGVKDLEILDGDVIRQREPNISEAVIGGLYCPNSGITSPYEMTVALAENAVANGVNLKLNEEVIGIVPQMDSLKVTTNKGDYYGGMVINAAGVFTDSVAKMIGDYSFEINPRKGQYVILDKQQGKLVNSVLFQVPNPMGKGVLVTPTLHGNLMIGPDANETNDKLNVDTEALDVKAIVAIGKKTVPNYQMSHALTTFSGLRATGNSGDFIIELSKVNQRLLHVAGIESPGLTASPAISEYICQLIEHNGILLKSKSSFVPQRQPIIQNKSKDFKGGIDDTNPNTHIICRCEQVTEAEILDALSRGIPVDSLDGIKRRCRTTMGVCQGNFCSQRVAKVIAAYHHINIEEVKQRSEGSGGYPRRVARDMLKKMI